MQRLGGSLTELLLNVQSADGNLRSLVENQLSQIEKNDFSQYCDALCDELCNETVPESSRQIAGIILKNAISGNDVKIDKEKRDKWIMLNPVIQSKVKGSVIKLLMTSSSKAAKVAGGLLIAKIARLELPQSTWPELLLSLSQMSGSNNAELRHACFQTLGYISQDLQSLSDELEKDLIDHETKSLILSCLCQGLTDSDNSAKLAAYKSFYYGVLFAEVFISQTADRQQLISLIITCFDTSSNVYNSEIETAAWEVLLQIASEYYQYLPDCMSVLRTASIPKFQCKTNAALSAIEFWSTLCDEELMILQKLSDKVSQNFISSNKDVLLPALFETVTLQEDEDYDPDEWTSTMAAGTCVSLCAQVIQDEILRPALTFIETNFAHVDWRRKNAAILIYGSILEGPSPNAFGELLAKSFQTLCVALNDQSITVRDTTAWTIGRIAKIHMPSIKPYVTGDASLIMLLVQKLTDVPRVSSNICFALFSLFDGFSNTVEASLLDSNFEVLATELLRTAERSDAEENQLRQNTFHALYMLVTATANTNGSLDQPLKTLLNRLLLVLSGTTDSYNEKIAQQLQGPVCGCLTALVNKLGIRNLQEFLEQLVNQLIKVCRLRNSEFSDAAEEAMLTLAAIFTDIPIALGTRYVPFVVPTVVEALKDCNGDQVTLASVSIELASSLTVIGDSLAPELLNEMVNQILILLKSPETNIKLKPKALVALTDFALLAPKTFQPHLQPLFEFLAQASQARVDQGPPNNEEWLLYITDLRDAALTGYCSAVCSVRELSPNASSPDKSLFFQMLEKQAPAILDFLYVVIGDSASTDSNIKNAVVLTQDLIPVFGANLVKHLTSNPFYELVRGRVNNSADPQLLQESMKLEELMTQFKGKA